MIALLLAVAAQGPATPAATPPRPAAVALAKVVAGSLAQPPRETEEAIVRRLLYTYNRRGLGCDPQVAACLAAAERIAREAAPAELAQRRGLYEQWLALLIEDAMTDAEIAAATRFAATPAGRAFASALLKLGTPSNLSPALRHRLAKDMMRAADLNRGDAAMLERFYDATATLPRQTLPVAPPAPPAPPAAPRKP